MISDSEVHRRDEIIDFGIAIRFFEYSFLESFQRLTMTYVNSPPPYLILDRARNFPTVFNDLSLHFHM